MSKLGRDGTAGSSTGGSRASGGISGSAGKNVNPINKPMKLGSPESRARLAVSENKAALEKAARIAKNKAIKEKLAPAMDKAITAIRKNSR